MSRNSIDDLRLLQRTLYNFLQFQISFRTYSELEVALKANQIHI